MSDFLQELFETYYKEQKKQDKIDLLENEIKFIKYIFEYRYRFDYEKLEAKLREKEEELKKLKENKDD